VRERIVGVGMLACSIVATPTFADPPPARPDYVASLPLRTWVFGKLLWQDREPCTPDLCEAGFNSAPLFLSVEIQPDVEENGEHKHIIQITTGISECDTVGWNVIRASAWVSLNFEQRLDLVSGRVRSLVELVERQCKARLVEPIPTGELKRLFLAPSALANDH
jgi:hypothetical protein